MSEEDHNTPSLYQKFPVNIDRGLGARVWDNLGKEYIDCMGGYGVALVGHCNARVVDAIKNQAERLLVCHMSLYNDTREDFIKKRSPSRPRDLTRSFLATVVRRQWKQL